MLSVIEYVVMFRVSNDLTNLVKSIVFYVTGNTTFNRESLTTFHHLYNCFCRGNEDEWFLHENTKKEMSTLAKRPQQPQDYNHHQDGLLLDVDEDLGGWVQKITLRIYESNSNLGEKKGFFFKCKSLFSKKKWKDEGWSIIDAC